ncbi:MAG: hypothetical protein JSW58_08255 [Candidatus Latescibacterota bacterium]|nr:MAG: hypothetical protein JSW58_08255 [Candidatus Latescibacterota bacterium]
MKKHRIPFKPYDTIGERFLQKSDPEHIDPDFYLFDNLLFTIDRQGPFFIRAAHERKTFFSQGPIRPPHLLFEETLVDAYPGSSAFIFCTGPSSQDCPIPPDVSDRSITIAVNSAIFLPSKFRYWTICEGIYMRWVLRRCDARWEKNWKWQDQECLIPGRILTWFRSNQWGVKINSTAYITRWEEELILPPRNPAPSLGNALVSAWQMGCKNAYLIGVDQGKVKGEVYPKKLFTNKKRLKESEANLKFQRRFLNDFSLPGMTIYNGSPHSWHLLKRFKKISYREIGELMRDPK